MIQSHWFLHGNAWEPMEHMFFVFSCEIDLIGSCVRMNVKTKLVPGNWVMRELSVDVSSATQDLGTEGVVG